MLFDSTKHKDWMVRQDKLPYLLDGESPELLGEDIFQAQKERFLVDVGWYGEENGFIIYLIKDQDWDNPYVRIRCLNMNGIKDALDFCVCYSRGIIA